MPDSEKPLSRRARIAIAIVLWCIGVPFSIGLWMLARWFSLLVIVPALWATWGYVKRGDMFSAVDQGVGGLGRYVPGGLSDGEKKRRR